MTVSQAAENGAFPFRASGAVAGKIDSAPEGFSRLVQETLPAGETPAAPSPKEKQWTIAKQRIAEVGFAQYAREQYEIKKMLRLMEVFAEKAPQDMQREFETIIADLEENPPRHPLEMYARIEAAIERISATAPSTLKHRMKKAYAQLREEMEKYDPELERLERMERQKRLQTNYHPEALLTAAFL